MRVVGLWIWNSLIHKSGLNGNYKIQKDIIIIHDHPGDDTSDENN